jgi:hypothetical protein
MAARGVTGLPLLIIEHPLGGQPQDAVLRRARQAFDQLTRVLGARG